MGDLGNNEASDFSTSLDTNPTPLDGTGKTDHKPGEGALKGVLQLQAVLGLSVEGNKTSLKALIDTEHNSNGKHKLPEHEEVTSKHTNKYPINFFQDDVAASQSDVALLINGSASADGFRAPWAGSIVGIMVLVATAEARLTDTLTVEPTVEGTPVSPVFSAVLDGTNTEHHSNTQAIEQTGSTFSAGDKIGAVVTTGGSWTPVSADISVVVFVSYN